MTFPVNELVIAGWTGRDEAALRKHIRELEEIGVKPPKTTPIFYRVRCPPAQHRERDPGVGAGHERRGGVRAAAQARRLVGHRRLRPHRPQSGNHRRVALEAALRQTDRKGRLALRRSERPLGAAHASLMVRRRYQEGNVTAMRAPEDLLGRYPLQPGW